MIKMFRSTLLISVISGLSLISTAGQTPPRPTGTSQKTATASTGLKPVIWADPGAVERLDFVYGVGGKANAPRPPFTFLEENLKGTNPKIRVKDSTGAEWAVKWGDEVSAETFATRVVWAAGYFVEAAYFVREGKVQGVTGLERAKSQVKPDGSFMDARFERRTKGVKTLEGEESWSWVVGPFVGKKEFNGLKVVVMLLSNWDNKDSRDAGRGSNTAIVQTTNEARYMVTDWGGSLGKWGGFMSREKWDCKGFTGQTKDFVKGIKNGFVEFGYSGQHSGDFKERIEVADVRWIMQYLGRITDAQLKSGLASSGATPEEAACFTAALRTRINQLQLASKGR
jgi:hypothetical protein